MNIFCYVHITKIPILCNIIFKVKRKTERYLKVDLL